MKRFSVLALFLLCTVAFAQSQTKKKPSVFAVFQHARFVWVESMDGDIFTPTLLPEDRRAIVAVQKALRDWGRYSLTANRSDADLIFVVRTGRVADTRVGGRVGNTGTVSPNDPGARPRHGGTGDIEGDTIGTEVMAGGGVGPPDDMLKVVTGNDARRGAQLWLRSEKDGLTGPRVPLLQQLIEAVDHDYPR